MHPDHPLPVWDEGSDGLIPDWDELHARRAFHDHPAPTCDRCGKPAPDGWGPLAATCMGCDGWFCRACKWEHHHDITPPSQQAIEAQRKANREHRERDPWRAEP